jgi:hypothetical protein
VARGSFAIAQTFPGGVPLAWDLYRRSEGFTAGREDIFIENPQ